jgi:hypothetical protein
VRFRVSRRRERQQRHQFVECSFAMFLDKRRH